MTMDTLLISAAFLLSSLGAAQMPAATQTSPVKGGAVSVTESQASATVVKVSRDKKYVTVKMAEGKKTKIGIPAEFQGLEELTPGAKISLRYLESIALAFAKPGQPLGAQEETMRLAPTGGVPEEIVVNTRKVNAMVQDIDRSAGKVVVKTHDGKTLNLEVPNDTPGFDDVKVGDSVLLRYTESVALQASPK